MLVPPYSSSTVIPSRPSSPIFRHRPIGNGLLLSLSPARGPISTAANCCTVARSMSTVSPRWKFSAGKLSIAKLSGLSVRLAGQHDERLLHDRAKRSLSAGFGVDLAARNGKRPARFDDFGLRDQALSRRRREQVELVFDRQHAGVPGKERKPGIATGGVDDGTDDTGMHVAVLLREVVAIR